MYSKHRAVKNNLTFSTLESNRMY